MKNLSLSLLLVLGLLAEARGQISNPSFESGLSNWVVRGNAFVNGPSYGDPPYGTDGSHVAHFGGFDVPDSSLQQTIHLVPNTSYSLSFSLGSFAFSSNLETRVRVMVTNALGTVFGSNNYNAFSPAGPGTNGFVNKEFSFRTQIDASNLVLIFFDTTTNGGIGVNPLLDHLRLSVVSGTTSNLLSNFSFEQGLSQWISTNVAIYGPPIFTRIGTDGTNVAALGADDQTGGILERQFVASEGTYEMSFDIAAMGSAGLRGITFLEIISGSGRVLFTQTYTNFGNGLVPFGSPPFQRKTVVFTTETSADLVIIRLSDLSPNGGQGIDSILDNFHLRFVSFPARIRMYPGITLEGELGKTYVIDYADGIPSIPANWVNLTNVILRVSPTIIFDVTATNSPKRFYRTTLLP